MSLFPKILQPRTLGKRNILFEECTPQTELGGVGHAATQHYKDVKNATLKCKTQSRSFCSNTGSSRRNWTQTCLAHQKMLLASLVGVEQMQELLAQREVTMSSRRLAQRFVMVQLTVVFELLQPDIH